MNVKVVCQWQPAIRSMLCVETVGELTLVRLCYSMFCVVLSPPANIYYSLFCVVLSPHANIYSLCCVVSPC